MKNNPKTPKSNNKLSKNNRYPSEEIGTSQDFQINTDNLNDNEYVDDNNIDDNQIENYIEEDQKENEEEDQKENEEDQKENEEENEENKKEEPEDIQREEEERKRAEENGQNPESRLDTEEQRRQITNTLQSQSSQVKLTESGVQETVRNDENDHFEFKISGTKKNLLSHEDCSANISDYKGKFYVCQISGGSTLSYICEHCKNICHEKHKNEKPTEGRFTCKCAENDHQLPSNDSNMQENEGCVYDILFQYSSNSGYYLDTRKTSDNKIKKYICAVCYEYCKNEEEKKNFMFVENPKNIRCICEKHDFSSAILLKGDFYARKNFSSYIKNFNFNIFLLERENGVKLKKILLDALISKLKEIFKDNIDSAKGKEEFKKKMQGFLADQNHQAILTILYIATMKWNNKFFYLDLEFLDEKSIKYLKEAIITEIVGDKKDLNEKYDKYKVQIYLINLLFCVFFKKEYITNFNLLNKQTILNMNIYQRYYFIHNKVPLSEGKNSSNFTVQEIKYYQDYIINRLISIYKKMLEEFSTDLSIIKKMKYEIFPCLNYMIKYAVKYNIINEGNEKTQKNNIKVEYFEIVAETFRSFEELRDKEENKKKDDSSEEQKQYVLQQTSICASTIGLEEQANPIDTPKDFKLLSLNFPRKNKEDTKEKDENNNIELKNNEENSQSKDNEESFVFATKTPILILKTILYYLLYKNDQLILSKIENDEGCEEFINNIQEKQSLKTMQNVKYCFYYLLNYDKLGLNFSSTEKGTIKELINYIFKIACSEQNDNIYYKGLKNLNYVPSDFKKYHDEIYELRFKNTVPKFAVKKFLVGEDEHNAGGLRKIFRNYCFYCIKGTSSENFDAFSSFTVDISKLLETFSIEIEKIFYLPDLSKESDNIEYEITKTHKLQRFQQYLKTSLIFEGLEEIIYPIGMHFDFKEISKENFEGPIPSKELRIFILKFYALIMYNDPEMLTLIMNVNPKAFIRFFIFVDDELFMFLNRVVEMVVSNPYYYCNLTFIKKCIYQVINLLKTNNQNEEDIFPINPLRKIKIIGHILKLLTKLIRKGNLERQLEFAHTYLDIFNLISEKDEEDPKKKKEKSLDNASENIEKKDTKKQNSTDKRRKKKSSIIKKEEEESDKKEKEEGNENGLEQSGNLYLYVISNFFRELAANYSNKKETTSVKKTLDSKSKEKNEKNIINYYIANYLEFMACLYESDIQKYTSDIFLNDENVINIAVLDVIMEKYLMNENKALRNLIDFKIVYPLFHYYFQKKLPCKTNLFFIHNYIINMISDVDTVSDENKNNELMNKANANFVNMILVKKDSLSPTEKKDLEESIRNEVINIFNLAQIIQKIINTETFLTFLEYFNQHVEDLGSYRNLILYYCQFFQNIILRPFYFLVKNIEMYIEYIEGERFSQLQHIVLDLLKSSRIMYFNIDKLYDRAKYNKEDIYSLPDYFHEEKINIKSKLNENELQVLYVYRPILINKQYIEFKEIFESFDDFLQVIFIYDFEKYKSTLEIPFKQKVEEVKDDGEINEEANQENDDINFTKKTAVVYEKLNIEEASEDEIFMKYNLLSPLDKTLVTYKKVLTQKSEFIKIQNNAFDLAALNSEYFTLFQKGPKKPKKEEPKKFARMETMKKIGRVESINPAMEKEDFYKIANFKIYKLNSFSDFISIMKCISDFNFIQNCNDKEKLASILKEIAVDVVTKRYLSLIVFSTLNELIKLMELHSKEEFLTKSLHCVINKLLTRFFQILCEGDQKKLKNYFFKFVFDTTDIEEKEKMTVFKNFAIKTHYEFEKQNKKKADFNKDEDFENNPEETFTFFNIISNAMRILIAPFQPVEKTKKTKDSQEKPKIDLHEMSKFDMVTGIIEMFCGYKDLMIEMIQGCTLGSKGANFEDENKFSKAKGGPKSYSGFYYLCNEVGRLFKDEKSIFNYRTSEFKFEYLFDEFTLDIKIYFLEILNNILKQSFSNDVKCSYVYQTLTETKRFYFIGDYIKYVYLRYVYPFTKEKFESDNNYINNYEFALILAGGPFCQTQQEKNPNNKHQQQGNDEGSDGFAGNENSKENTTPIMQLKESDLKLLLQAYKVNKKMWKDKYLQMACLIHYIMTNLGKKTKNKECIKYFKLIKDDVSFEKAEYELTGKAHQKESGSKVQSDDKNKKKDESSGNDDENRSNKEDEEFPSDGNKPRDDDTENKATADISLEDNKSKIKSQKLTEVEEIVTKTDEQTPEQAKPKVYDVGQNEEQNQKKIKISINDFFDARERSKLLASKFLNKILKSIKIAKKSEYDNKPPMIKECYFRLTPDLYKIKKRSINTFLDQVDRSSPSAKLKSILEKLDEYMDEIRYKDKNTATFFSIDLYDFDYTKVDKFNFISSLMVVTVYLKFCEKNGDTFGQKWILAMHYYEIFVVVVNIFFIIVFLFSKYKLCTYLLVCKKTREEEQDSKGENEDENQDSKQNYKFASLLDKISSFFDLFNIYVNESFLTNSDIRMMIFIVIFGLLGLYTNYDIIFYSCQLISISVYSSTILDILRAFGYRIDQLGSMIVFLAILMYVWATIDLYFFKKDFLLTSEDEVTGEITEFDACTSLMDCFITLFNNGARSGGGIGDVLGDKEYDGSAWYYVRWVHDLLFFVAVILLLLNMINGVIVNTFTSLREENSSREEDIKNKCFICGVERYEIEKLGKSFEEHVNNEHKVKSYIRFLVYIKFMDNTEMDQDQYHVYHCLLNDDLSLFPTKSGSEN